MVKLAGWPNILTYPTYCTYIYKIRVKTRPSSLIIMWDDDKHDNSSRSNCV